jgi:hypothetical protein
MNDVLLRMWVAAPVLCWALLQLQTVASHRCAVAAQAPALDAAVGNGRSRANPYLFYTVGRVDQPHAKATASVHETKAEIDHEGFVAALDILSTPKAFVNTPG